jgi:hypothetical protein
VIGQITKIDESKTQQKHRARPGQPGVETPFEPVQNDPTIRSGVATVAVKEVLKGSAVKKIEFPVVLEDLLVRQGGPLRAQILPIRSVGQSGIWISGRPVEFCNVAQAPAVRRILQALKENKWSEPVNGLRAWALVDERVSGIIFAVKNVSNEVIYLPRSRYPREPAAPGPGLFAATVKSTSGKTLEFSLDAARPRSERIPCEKLSPGETTYLHPGQWRRDKLSPGKYSAVVTYKNDRADGEVRDRSSPPPVTAWTGELKAPPVAFVLTADDIRGWKDAPRPVPQVGPPVPQAAPKAAAPLPPDSLTPVPTTSPPVKGR